MSLGLSLLLTTAAAALDRLWLLRISRATPVLLADQADPGLHSPLEPAPEAEDAALRGRLLQIGARMRELGLAELARAILAQPLPPQRQASLLGLAGAAPWQPHPGGAAFRQRQGADGALYVLRLRAGDPAAHAPHAAREQEQSLWLCAAPSSALEDAPLARRISGVACLSQDAALRDVALMLRAEGALDLARSVQALAAAADLPWPQPLPAPAAAQPRPVAA